MSANNINNSEKRKIVVVGGTGLIGREVVRVLEKEKNEIVIASPSKGINAVTGLGLADALLGAEIVY